MLRPQRTVFASPEFPGETPGANTAPVASDGSLFVAVDTPQDGTLVAVDGESDALTYSIVGNGSSGTAVVTNAATGAYTYTPDAAYTGSDSFTFKANDGEFDSNTATIDVTVGVVGLDVVARVVPWHLDRLA